MTVILERLTGAFALNCELFFLTLLFSLPLGRWGKVVLEAVLTDKLVS